MQGTKFALHPVTVLLSVAFWGYLWDVAGLILAVPMVASLQIVLANVDYPLAQSISSLLAGQVAPKDNLHAHARRELFNRLYKS